MKSRLVPFDLAGNRFSYPCSTTRGSRLPACVRRYAHHERNPASTVWRDLLRRSTSRTAVRHPPRAARDQPRPRRQWSGRLTARWAWPPLSSGTPAVTRVKFVVRVLPKAWPVGSDQCSHANFTPWL